MSYDDTVTYCDYVNGNGRDFENSLGVVFIIDAYFAGSFITTSIVAISHQFGNMHDENTNGVVK